MAIIHVSGNIGRVLFIPGNPAEKKLALLNVGVCEKKYRKDGVQSVWYQALWTGEEAEKKRELMLKVKSISVMGEEDFKVKEVTHKIERTIWVRDETLHWKERDQLEMDFNR